MKMEQTRSWSKMDTIRIVVLGCTGSGKSSLSNCLLRENIFESRLSSKPVTTKSQVTNRVLKGRKFCVIDTPGLFDTSLTGIEVIKEIKDVLSLSCPGPNVFLFVARIGRFADVSDILKNYIGILGERVMEFTTLVFTGLDELEKEGISIQNYLDDSPPFLENLLRKYTYVAIDSRKINKITQKQLLQEIQDLIQRNSETYFRNEEFESSLRRNRKYRPITAIKEQRMKGIVKAWKNLRNQEIQLRRTEEKENMKQQIQCMVDKQFVKRTRSAQKSIEKLLHDNGIFDLLQYSEMEKEDVLFGTCNTGNQFITRKTFEIIS